MLYVKNGFIKKYKDIESIKESYHYIIIFIDQH